MIPLQVSGTGRTSGSQTVRLDSHRAIRFETEYAAGTNTMAFAGHALVLAKAGTELTIGTKTFSLTGEGQTIVVNANGSMEVLPRSEKK